MQITITIRGPLANTMKVSKIDVEIRPQQTVRESLENLLHQYPRARELWSGPEDIDRDALILCNETDIALMNGLDTQVEEGDKITILPLIHGG